MSSTHMKITIAFRRVSTPTAPIVKRTAESASDSASICSSPASEYDGADDRDEEQDARELERQEVLREHGLCYAPDRAQLAHGVGVVAAAGSERFGEPLAGER